MQLVKFAFLNLACKIKTRSDIRFKVRASKSVKI